MQKNNSNEDFDLYNLIINLKNKINKWKVLIIIGPLLGIIIGLSVYYFSPKQYLSLMAVNSNLLKGAAFVIVINDLQSQIMEGNTDAIKKFLNVDELTAKKIKGLKVFSSRRFVDRKLNTDIPDIENRDEETNFIIEACIEDNDILPQLETGLLYYLQNNYYMKDKGTRLKKELSNIISIIDQELLSLDTLKRSLNEVYSLGNSSKISSIYINDPGKIADDIVKLYRLKEETQDRLIMIDVKIVERFVPNKKPYSPKLFFSIISWFFSFVILTILIIALVEFNEKLKEKEHSK